MKLLKNATIILTLTIIILLTIMKASLLCVYFSLTTKTSVETKQGQIVISVLEAGSLKPIENATICVVETRTYFQTDSNGFSEKINVPILINKNFNLTLTPPNGEITLLVYKSGYADNITFFVKVPTNKTRLGIVVLLTPIYSDNDISPKISAEVPDETWAKQIIQLSKR